MRGDRQHLVAVLAVLGAAVLFGTTGTAKELGPDSAGAMGVGTMRIVIGAVVLWVITRTLPRLADLRANAVPLLIGGAGVAAYQPGFFAGTERLGVALGTIIALGSGPLFAGLLELSLGTRPSRRWLAATLLSIAGGGLLVFSGSSESRLSALGLLGAFTGGFGYALYAVVTKRLILRGVDATVASAWQFSIGAIALLPLLAFQPMGWLTTGGGVLMALHLGVLATGVAYLLYGIGLRVLDTATTTTLTLAEPVTASLIAVAVLDERLRLLGWVGAAVVLAGLALAGRGSTVARLMETELDLDPYELRVLGCLIEKESTTPDNYPLTVNSLRNACNQSTNRDPVVDFSELEIEQALTTLRTRGFTRTVHSTSNRATKYRHVMPEVLALDEAETALLSVLMLRGPQTLGELKGRAERQHTFDSLDAVGDCLGRLAARDQPLALQLERRPGQKDARWIHLLGTVDLTQPESPTTGSGRSSRTVLDADPSDPYSSATAEFYDLLATDMWERFGLQLLDLLADVDPGAGPIIDLGVGTGIGLPYVVEAVPGARVFAIEPSKAMRVALHARLTDDRRLREITTVSPTGLAGAKLPTRASAIVGSAVYGHLTQAERDRLWRYVAEQMPVGAPAVIGVLPPDRPVTVPLVKYHELPVGDYVYEGLQSGVPIDDRSMAWTLVYRVRDSADGELIAEYSATAPWRCDGVADVLADIAPFGLTLTEHDDCVVVRRPGP